jgi:hypothetical protein
MTQQTPEISNGFGSSLKPAESFSAYAHSIIESSGARTLGERVAKLVYEKGFEASTGLTTQEVIAGRGYIQMLFYGKCAEFAKSIVPPLEIGQRAEFDSGALEFGRTEV